MTSSQSEVFCDWLDVTYSPVDYPELEIQSFIQAIGCHCVFDDERSSVWQCGDGKLKFERRSRYARISASGAVLAHLRTMNLYHRYLILLSSTSHTVTRLDAALDVESDGADVVADLITRYPLQCALSHKPQGVRTMLSPRASDGRWTGTFYVGNRRAGKLTARVYDKAQESLDVRGILLPPTTRYEITARREIGATLRDAALPASLFWHYASPALLQRPEGINPWSPGASFDWSYCAEERLPAAVLRYRVESSPDLAAMIALADQVGPMGREYLLSLLKSRVDADGSEVGCKGHSPSASLQAH